MKKLSLVLIASMALSLTACNSQITTPEKVVEHFTVAMLNFDNTKAASYCTKDGKYGDVVEDVSTVNFNEEGFAERLHFLSDKKQQIVRSSNVPSSEVEVFAYFYDKNNNERVGQWMFLLKQEDGVWKISCIKLR